MRSNEESSLASLRLKFPVHTPDNRLLLPTGAVLSSKALKNLISANTIKPLQTRVLFKHGTVRRDLLDQIKIPPFDLIFSNEAKVRKVINVLENYQIPTQVLESLDYFKGNNYYTYCHMLRVFTLSSIISLDLLPDYREWTAFVATGPTHDIGKICVPMHLLKKETPLTRNERSHLFNHSAAGYVLLSCFYRDHRHFAAIVARDHHERRDRSGIPRGIQLRRLMVETVIVCDIYDALISSRSYRPEPFDNRTALEELTRMAEMKQIGWKPVRSLVALNRKTRPSAREVSVSIDKRGTPPLHNFYGVLAD